MAVMTVKDKKRGLVIDVEPGKITPTPKSAVGPGIEQGLDDLNLGRVYGPYASAAAAKKAFDNRTRALKMPRPDR